MRSEIKNKKIIFAWLQKGEDDLNFAERALEETDFYDHVCFLSEQAVEKYLKALVVIQKGKITQKEKTHNLIYLSSLCKELMILRDFEQELRLLSEAYIPARYPVDAYTKATKEDAKKCFKSAEKIINLIKDKVDFGPYFQ